MATRLYIPSSGAPAISPAFDTTPWPTTTNAERRQLVTTRINSAMVSKDGVALLTSGTHELIYQCLIGPLNAQTVTGSFKGQLRARTTNLGARYMALRLISTNADGSVVTERLARTQASDATSNVPPGYSNAATPVNRRFETSPANTFTLSFSNFDVDLGGYVGLEIGNGSASSSSPRTGTIVFGDDSGSDLPEDETTDTANNPWVEFTHNFVFQTLGGGIQHLRQLQSGLPHRRVYI